MLVPGLANEDNTVLEVSKDCDLHCFDWGSFLNHAV